MCANSEDSGETAPVAGRLCYKYHKRMSWLINFVVTKRFRDDNLANALSVPSIYANIIDTA